MQKTDLEDVVGMAIREATRMVDWDTFITCPEEFLNNLSKLGYKIVKDTKNAS